MNSSQAPPQTNKPCSPRSRGEAEFAAEKEEMVGCLCSPSAPRDSATQCACDELPKARFDRGGSGERREKRDLRVICASQRLRDGKKLDSFSSDSISPAQRGVAETRSSARRKKRWFVVCVLRLLRAILQRSVPAMNFRSSIAEPAENAE